MNELNKTFIGIPVLNRLDLLAECLSHIDYPAETLIVNNNSVDESFTIDLEALADEIHAEVLHQKYNIGVAASWNLIIRTAISRGHELVFIGSNDTFLEPGSLKAVLDWERAEKEAVWHISAWNFFAIHERTVERVGWFDENFYPAYKEDQDYSYRCQLAGAERVDVITGASARHLGSQTIMSDPEYRHLNENTHFNWNRNHYLMKWGGDAGAETFRSPYNRGDKNWSWWPDPGGSIAARDWDKARRPVGEGTKEG